MISMRPVLAAMILAATVLPAPTQDTQTPAQRKLAWKLEAGKRLRMSWKSRLEQTSTVGGQALPKTDAALAIRGVLTVLETPEEGPPVCELKIDGYELKGVVQGREVDGAYDNGEMKSATGLPEGGADVKKLLDEPLRLTLSAQGEFKAQDQGRLSRLFAGDGVWFGSRLPAGAVAVGESWDETLQTAQSKARGGPSFTVKRKLESFDAGVGRIVTDEEKDFEQTGIRFKVRIAADDRFDLERGVCSKSKSSTSAKGSGEVQGREVVITASSTIELEVSPATND